MSLDILFLIVFGGLLLAYGALGWFGTKVFLSAMKESDHVLTEVERERQLDDWDKEQDAVSEQLDLLTDNPNLNCNPETGMCFGGKPREL